MSDVRVNLLPREVEEEDVARRQRLLVVVLALLLVAVMAVLYVLQLNRVSDAEEELAAEQATRRQLQQEVEALQEFARLEERVGQAAGTLTTALGGEVTVAGILQDIAAVMPTDAALATLNISLGETDQGTFALGGPAVGRVSGSGQSLRGHAPGVERFLLEFDKVAAFSNVFFSGSTVDEEGTTTFTFEIDLGPEMRTGRYGDGLPEELR